MFYAVILKNSRIQKRHLAASVHLVGKKSEKSISSDILEHYSRKSILFSTSYYPSDTKITEFAVVSTVGNLVKALSRKRTKREGKRKSQHFQSNFALNKNNSDNSCKCIQELNKMGKRYKKRH
jgi:hypothetical protein